MPFYHFNVFGERDLDGTGLPSPLHAKKVGLKFLGELLAHGSIEPRTDKPCLEVIDSTGAILFQFSVTVAVGNVRSTQTAGA